MKLPPFITLPRIITVVTCLLAICFSFTTWYVLGALLILGLFTWQPFYRHRWFESLVSTFLVNLLIYTVVLSAVAAVCWVGKVQVPAILPLAIFALGAVLFQRVFPSSAGPRVWATKKDLLAIVLAGLGVAIFVITFFGGTPLTTASIQAIANGWDNGSHLAMLETTHAHHGFIFGHFPSLQNDMLIPDLTGYPLGWHYINAYLFTFIGNDHIMPSTFVFMYILSMLAWWFLAVFFFTKVSLEFWRNLESRATGSAGFIGLILGNLLFQVTIFTGIFHLGFATFMGVVPYFLLIIALLISLQPRDTPQRARTLAVCLLLTIPISVIWPLATPISLSMIVLSYLRKTILIKLYTTCRQNLWMAAALLLSAAGALGAFGFQMLMQAKYFPMDLGAILNHEGGVFGISYTYMLILGVATGAYLVWLATHTNNKPAKTTIPAIIAPALIYIFSLYFYQSFSTNSVNYFFLKILALGILVLGVFFCAAFAQVLHSLRRAIDNPFYLTITGLLMVMGLITLTGQSLFDASALVQSRSKIDLRTAEAIKKSLPATTRGDQGSVIVYRQRLPEEDNIGTYMAYTANHRYSACTIKTWNLMGHDQRKAIPAQINRCAAHMPITVIVSGVTYNEMAALHNPNITLYSVR